MKDYKKEVMEKVSQLQTTEQVIPWKRSPLSGLGSFLISVDVPLKNLEKFREEYKQLKNIGTFEGWDDNLNEYIRTTNNPIRWGVIYRLWFNASMEKLEELKETYGDSIFHESGARAEYLYHIDNMSLIKKLLKDGAHLGRNEAVGDNIIKQK